MKTLIFLVTIIAVAFIGVSFGGDSSCATVPSVNITSCCRYPNAVDENTVKKSIEVVAKQNLVGDYLKDCKIKEEIFKQLNLIKSNDIDKEAALTYLDNQLKEADWKKLYKESFGACFGEMTSEIISEIQKQANFTRDQCDVKFEAVVSCMEIAVFAGCPKAAWNDRKDCNDGKTFVEKCHDNVEAMEKFYENQLK